MSRRRKSQQPNHIDVGTLVDTKKHHKGNKRHEYLPGEEEEEEVILRAR